MTTIQVSIVCLTVFALGVLGVAAITLQSADLDGEQEPETDAGWALNFGEQVALHIADTQFVRGVVIESAEESVTLEAASLYSDGEPTSIGKATVPRDAVILVQHLSPEHVEAG